MSVQWIRRWPDWAGVGAAVWSLPYAVVAGHWAAGGLAGYPWRRPDGELLGDAAIARWQGGLALAACLAGTAAAVAAGSRPPRTGNASAGPDRPRRYGPGVISASLALVMSVVTLQTFGLVLGAVGSVAAGRIANPAGLAVQLYCVAGTALYAATATAWRRRRRRRCPRCGGAHLVARSSGPLSHPTPSPAPRRLRWTAYAALLGVVPWSGLKLWWNAGGDALGVTAQEWDRAVGEDGSAVARALAAAGIDITVLAAGIGVLLVAALTRPWGQRLPGRLPIVGGMRPPRWVLLAPAWTTAASLMPYGYSLIVVGGLTTAGVVDLPADPGEFTAEGLAWMGLFGGTAFAGLGAALALGAWSYQCRTRPRCRPGLDHRQADAAASGRTAA